MKEIRIGNDISVRWSIYRDGQPFLLTGTPLKLYLKNQFGKTEVEGYTISGNVISWTFFGKAQKNLGEYSLVLVMNEGSEGMVTTDACNFVRLLACSCKLQSGEDPCGVKTETVEVSSSVDMGGLAYAQEVLSAVCPLDFNDDFSNDFSIGL